MRKNTGSKSGEKAIQIRHRFTGIRLSDSHKSWNWN